MDDSFGDRMKLYEGVEAQRRLMPLLPAIIRLDGKCFSSFTRGLERPYDPRMSESMVALTMALVEETNALIGYTQSDEITLILYSSTFDSKLYFDGRIQKILSCLSGFAALRFAQIIRENIPEKATIPAVFDCRVYNVPNQQEAVNSVLWREQDATKNSISMAARAYYSHKAMHNKSGPEMQEMLFLAGVNWNNYPDFFKRGTYVRRTRVSRPFTISELELLSLKHEARKNPELMVERTLVQRMVMPVLSKVQNRVDVFFRGEDPVTDTTALKEIL